MVDTATLVVDGKEITLEVSSPSEGQDVINVASLVNEGLFTFDPGFLSTASCESTLTYIDGDQGKLLHRGYSIEQLAEKSNYMELCYLLLRGELPAQSELANFIAAVEKETVVHEQLVDICSTFPPGSHPMGMLGTLVSAMSAFYHDGLDINDPDQRMQVAIRLLAQIPICAAIVFRHHMQKERVDLRPGLSYADQFYHLMFSESNDSEVDPILSKALDQIFLLHADHEQNASTSTVRLVGSTDANPYGCIAAGIAALWGPSHGGANEGVLKMIAEIGDESRIPQYIKKAKDRDDPFRIMGFGHRVYKNFDPRAACVRATCNDVLDRLGIKDDPILEIAKTLAKIAREDEYFIERRLYPNVDFYSGVILRALGIPQDYFTVIFAVGRTAGWIAQWHEMVSDGYKIGRPRQKYTGPRQRDYVAIDQRS